MCNNTLSIFANKNSFNDTFLKIFHPYSSCNSRVFYLYMETAFVHRSPLFLFCYLKNRSIPVFIYIYVYGNSVFSPFHPSSCFVISKLIQFPFFFTDIFSSFTLVFVLLFQKSCNSRGFFYRQEQHFLIFSPLFLFHYLKNRAFKNKL